MDEAIVQLISLCNCATRHAHRRAIRTVLTFDSAAGRSEKRYRSEEGDVSQANGHKRSRLHDASGQEGVQTHLACLSSKLDDTQPI